MWTPEEKHQINKILSENGCAKKPVFDLMAQGGSREAVEALIEQLVNDAQSNQPEAVVLREYNPNVAIYGRRLIAQNAIDDFYAIMRLPWMIGGAIMPDGHRVSENKAPVGSVFVSDGLVFPGIVGSDICCSVYQTLTSQLVDDEWFDTHHPSLVYVLKNRAMFGAEMNSTTVARQQAFYQNVPTLETTLAQDVWHRIYGMAVNTFGTSGDGNHFAEWGYTDVRFDSKGKITPAPKGQKYLAMMTHFGSRTVGSTIAKAYEKLANDKYDMPHGMTDAPLDLNTPDGRDYWRLMQWAGEFTEAGHRWLHAHLLAELEKRVALTYEPSHFFGSRHNFAWSTDDGIVHRKGATPAAVGQYGVIPATMGDASQIVVGLGDRDSFESASHGGGRVLSRGQAMQQLSDAAGYVLREHNVHLIGGDSDEHPLAYKKIKEVMAEQATCVRTIGTFTPRVVRMAEPRFRRR
jgi:tRNA-splicing ligase RtcB